MEIVQGLESPCDESQGMCVGWIADTLKRMVQRWASIVALVGVAIWPSGVLGKGSERGV